MVGDCSDFFSSHLFYFNRIKKELKFGKIRPFFLKTLALDRFICYIKIIQIKGNIFLQGLFFYKKMYALTDLRKEFLWRKAIGKNPVSIASEN